MKVKLIGASALLLATVSVTQAQPYYPVGPYPGAERPALDAAQAETREGFGKLLKLLGTDRKVTKAEVAVFLEKEIVPYFDFGYMARWAAGPAYREMSPKQRAALVERIKEDFLTTLAQKLAGYGSQQVRFLPTRYRGPGEATVGVLIQHPGAYPAKLDFRFYRADDGWKVFDVTANGSSALVYYRQMLNRIWAGPIGMR